MDKGRAPFAQRERRANLRKLSESIFVLEFVAGCGRPAAGVGERWPPIDLVPARSGKHYPLRGGLDRVKHRQRTRTRPLANPTAAGASRSSLGLASASAARDYPDDLHDWAEEHPPITTAHEVGVDFLYWDKDGESWSDKGAKRQGRLQGAGSQGPGSLVRRIHGSAHAESLQSPGRSVRAWREDRDRVGQTLAKGRLSNASPAAASPPAQSGGLGADATAGCGEGLTGRVLAYGPLASIGADGANDAQAEASLTAAPLANQGA
jgi:hypothetical protein